MASTYYAWDYVDSEVPKGTYTEASYKATTKFRATHRAEYNKYMKDYHLKKMKEERLKGIADTEEEEPKYKSVAQPLTLVVECSGIADTIKGY